LTLAERLAIYSTHNPCFLLCDVCVVCCLSRVSSLTTHVRRYMHTVARTTTAVVRTSMLDDTIVVLTIKKDARCVSVSKHVTQASTSGTTARRAATPTAGSLQELCPASSVTVTPGVSHKCLPDICTARPPRILTPSRGGLSLLLLLSPGQEVLRGGGRRVLREVGVPGNARWSVQWSPVPSRGGPTRPRDTSTQWWARPLGGRVSNQRGELQCVGSGDAIRRAKSEQLAEQRERLCGREGMTRWQGEVVEGCHGPRAGGVARAPRGGSWGGAGWRCGLAFARSSEDVAQRRARHRLEGDVVGERAEAGPRGLGGRAERREDARELVDVRRAGEVRHTQHQLGENAPAAGVDAFSGALHRP
jgi:hypothetical protein